MLNDLDVNLNRLRVEYEQYFSGTLRRPPQLLQGRVQKTILYFAGNLPRNTRLKFRFNQLNARFQVFRQQWGRTMREIEAGTYKRHVFKARLHEAERDQNPPDRPSEPQESSTRKRQSGIDQLYDALLKARRKTGDHGSELDRKRLATLVRKQTSALRAKHGDAKIKFRVVIENNTAKLKATVSKP